MKACLIIAGALYTNGVQWRRLIAIHDLHVVYSTGGNRNHICTKKTFQRWARERRVSVPQLDQLEVAT